MVDLCLDRIDEAAFLAGYPLTRAAAADEGLALLEAGRAARDDERVETGLLLGFRFGIEARWHDVLVALAEAPWHERHEDVVSALDRLRDPRDVDVLFRVASARHAYLEWDDAHALGVKCAYALAKLGTAAARERLLQLAAGGAAAPVEEAARRLLAKRPG